MDYVEFCYRYMGRTPRDSQEDYEMHRQYERFMRDQISRVDYRREYQMWDDPGMMLSGSTPKITKDESVVKYEARKLKEYSKPEFKLDDSLLPKEMVPFAVKCPKTDVHNRVMAYING